MINNGLTCSVYTHILVDFVYIFILTKLDHEIHFCYIVLSIMFELKPHKIVIMTNFFCIVCLRKNVIRIFQFLSRKISFDQWKFITNHTTQCSTHQHTNYQDTTNYKGYLPWLKLLCSRDIYNTYQSSEKDLVHPNISCLVEWNVFKLLTIVIQE